MKIEIWPRPHLFYGWWMVIAGFAAVACGEGAYRYATTQLPLLFRENLGGSAGQMGAVLGLASVLGLLALLAIAPLLDRFGPRWPMVAGISLVGIALLTLGSIPGLIIVFLLVPLITVGKSAGFPLPAQTAAANWFIRRRTLALAVVSAGSVAGAGLALVSGQFPGRGTYLALGIALLVIAIPLALLMRHRPESHGYAPDGAIGPNEALGVPPGEPDVLRHEVNFNLGQSLRTKTFWLLAVAMVLAQGAEMVARITWPSLLMEKGLPFNSPFVADDFTPLIGILTFGFLGDRFSKRHLLTLAAVLQAVSTATLMAPGIIVPVLLYPLVSGLSSGTIPLLLAIRADYFGRRAFATITVATMLVTALLGFAVPLFVLLAGRFQEASNSFVPGMGMSVLIGLVAAGLFFLAREPRPPWPATAE